VVNDFPIAEGVPGWVPCGPDGMCPCCLSEGQLPAHVRADRVRELRGAGRLRAADVRLRSTGGGLPAMRLWADVVPVPVRIYDIGETVSGVAAVAGGGRGGDQ